MEDPTRSSTSFNRLDALLAYTRPSQVCPNSAVSPILPLFLLLSVLNSRFNFGLLCVGGACGTLARAPPAPPLGKALALCGVKTI